MAPSAGECTLHSWHLYVHASLSFRAATSSAFTSGRPLHGVADFLPGDADGCDSGVEEAWEAAGCLRAGCVGVRWGVDTGAALVGEWLTPGMALSRKLTTDRILIPMSSSSWLAAVTSLLSVPVSVRALSAFSSLETVQTDIREKEKKKIFFLFFSPITFSVTPKSTLLHDFDYVSSKRFRGKRPR